MKSIRKHIGESVDITQLILDVDSYAKETGFRADEVEAIKTASSELAHNMLKYAQKGEIFVRRIQIDHKKGLEVKSQDKGPGIKDIEQAMKDHFSSGKTLGLGLPGIQRLMDDFEIESVPNQGTTVIVRKWL